MKTPFPAYYFEAAGAPFHSVRVRPCSVLNWNQESGAALVALGSNLQSGRVEKWVTIHSLASSPKKAFEKFAELLPPLEPAAAKSAVTEMAGAAAGSYLPNIKMTERGGQSTP